MDRFSQLTDDLLIKILSFLPTKDAVAMSILSRRWLSLWTLVPKLIFDDCWVDNEETNEVHCKRLPSHFISGTLLLHKSPFLESFHLSRAFKCSASKIDLWVRIAVDRFVRDLKISFECEHSLIRLPSRLFRCETLETLELQNVILLEVPSRFSFPSLRTLRLRRVKYADEESFIRLISSSPVLKNLVVESCSDDNVATFTINVSSLESLTVWNTLQDSGPNANLFVKFKSKSLYLFVSSFEIPELRGETQAMEKISELPDDLLIKILSLIPTKDAVAMSVLSKRWMSLWTLVPRLLFDEKHHRNLSQFVSGTLLLHKAPVLERFHLKSASQCSASEIGLWVRIAVDRFVRDLKISFYFDHGLVKLPSRLFRCETLETLELHMVIVYQVPSRFSFPSLKKLRLVSVKYSDEESFSRLVSNCPVLEDLVLETCPGDNVVTFTVNVPSIQSLSIENTECGSGSDHLFVIYSHSLKLLSVVNYFGELNLIGNVPKLVEANLDSLCRHTKVLESFTFVRRLYLCLDGEARYPTGTVLFQLVRLELCVCEDKWTNMLASVLQHSPKLQVLKLVLKHRLAVDRKVCWIQPSCVPECLLFHLKTFEWRDYEGTKVEKQVAIYILKNAKQLVTATIYSDSVELARKHQMFEELEIASRGSRACELTMG